MNKIAFYQGYLDKTALTLPEMQSSFDKITINPAIRTALLAGAGYFGTKYAYRGLNNMIARARINVMHKDPRKREIAWQQHMKRQKSLEPWVAGAGAVAAGALPMVDMVKAFKPAWKKYKAPGGGLKDLAAPMLHNRLPASFDKYRDKFKGIQ